MPGARATDVPALWRRYLTSAPTRPIPLRKISQLLEKSPDGTSGDGSPLSDLMACRRRVCSAPGSNGAINIIRA